jgi:hypothetical protein
MHWPVNVVKSKAGIIYEPYKGARKDGWKGFGRGLGKGAVNFVSFQSEAS